MVVADRVRLSPPNSTSSKRTLLWSEELTSVSALKVTTKTAP
ncbi:hypothetical protein WEB32_26450 [Streptomyces netropsis]